MTYQEWLANYHAITPAYRAELERATSRLEPRPLISVLLPVYNPDLGLLEEAIASVRRQIYEKWELCIADDASIDYRVRPFLEMINQRDSRIRLLFREKNGHISAC